MEEINVELVPSSGEQKDIFNLIFKVDMSRVPANVPKIGHLAGNCNQGRHILRIIQNFWKINYQTKKSRFVTRTRQNSPKASVWRLQSRIRTRVFWNLSTNSSLSRPKSMVKLNVCCSIIWCSSSLPFETSFLSWVLFVSIFLYIFNMFMTSVLTIIIDNKKRHIFTSSRFSYRPYFNIHF